jgi:heme/copper-type cytochrome/quinol oxidase subunit 2
MTILVYGGIDPTVYIIVSLVVFVVVVNFILNFRRKKGGDSDRKNDKK